MYISTTSKITFQLLYTNAILTENVIINSI